MQTVENAVATSQGRVHLSTQEPSPECFECIHFIATEDMTWKAPELPACGNAFHKHGRVNFLPDPKSGMDVKMSLH